MNYQLVDAIIIIFLGLTCIVLCYLLFKVLKSNYQLKRQIMMQKKSAINNIKVINPEIFN